MVHLDGAVVASRSDPLAVGAEAQAVDRQTVALVGEDASLSSNVPQLYRNQRVQKKMDEMNGMINANRSVP